jgi:small subunit ribosomal protein S8
MQDPISDMITRIKNAQMAKFKTVSMPSSKIKLAIAKVLQEQGYIEDFKKSKLADATFDKLNIRLKYTEDGRPVIEDIKRVSRPGLRVYKGSSELPIVKGGLGIAIVSTSKGLMCAGHAKAQSLGGEVLCTVV